MSYRSRFVAAVLTAALPLATVTVANASTPEAQTQTQPEAQARDTDELIGAITQAIYFVPQTGKLVVNEAQVRAQYPGLEIENGVFDNVRAQLDTLTDDEVDAILEDNGYNPAQLRVAEGEATANIAPIVWVAGVAIVSLVTGALIFTSRYFSHQEKLRLIDECARVSGYPEVDSRDSGGVKGNTNSFEANAAGGYNFKCRKR